jgi:UDP-3-O-[3-hydroxymyristoyl] glucosamine N-acyltransferase
VAAVYLYQAFINLHRAPLKSPRTYQRITDIAAVHRSEFGHILLISGAKVLAVHQDLAGANASVIAISDSSQTKVFKTTARLY